MTKIRILRAFHGDCILIETVDADGLPFTILVDGGPSKTFKLSMRQALKHIEVIDILVLTHIDSDHIAGLISFLKSSMFERIEIRKYWINGANLVRVSKGGEISYQQAFTLEKLLLERHEPASKWRDQLFFTGKEIKLGPGISAKILSPTLDILEALYRGWPELEIEASKKLLSVPISGDVPSQIKRGKLQTLAEQSFAPAKRIGQDLANASSIAFALNLPDTSILLLADSRAEIVENSLRKLGYSETNPLATEYVKVAHHGSKNNTSCSMLNLIDCEQFVISTNGGTGRTRHPDREVIARLLYHSGREQKNKRFIHFNYPLAELQKKCGALIAADDLLEGNWAYSAKPDCSLGAVGSPTRERFDGN